MAQLQSLRYVSGSLLEGLRACGWFESVELEPSGTGCGARVVVSEVEGVEAGMMVVGFDAGVRRVRSWRDGDRPVLRVTEEAVTGLVLGRVLPAGAAAPRSSAPLEDVVERSRSRDGDWVSVAGDAGISRRLRALDAAPRRSKRIRAAQEDAVAVESETVEILDSGDEEGPGPGPGPGPGSAETQKTQKKQRTQKRQGGAPDYSGLVHGLVEVRPWASRGERFRVRGMLKAVRRARRGSPAVAEVQLGWGRGYFPCVAGGAALCELGSGKAVAFHPAKGVAGALAVTSADLVRLERDMYLNDTLVELWLRLAMERGGERYRAAAHVLSPFFYDDLQQTLAAGLDMGAGARVDAGSDAFRAEAAAFASLRKWHRGVDLLGKELLLLPICQGFHWALAIVLAPGTAAEARGLQHRIAQLEAELKFCRAKSRALHVVDVPAEPKGRGGGRARAARGTAAAAARRRRRGRASPPARRKRRRRRRRQSRRTRRARGTWRSSRARSPRAARRRGSAASARTAT